MNVGDLVADKFFGDLAVVLRVGTDLNPNGVIIKFIKNGLVQTTFKSRVQLLGGAQ